MFNVKGDLRCLTNMFEVVIKILQCREIGCVQSLFKINCFNLI